MKHIHFYDIQEEILSDLYMSDEYIPISYFEDRFGYSQRTIRSYIANLKDQGMDIEYKRNKGYRLLNKEAVDFKTQFAYRKIEDQLSRKEIRWMMEITILLMSSKYVSLSNLADRLYISKTAAKNDMDEIYSIFSNFHIQIDKDSHGHFIKESSKQKLNHLLDIYGRYNLNVQIFETIFNSLYEDNRYFQTFEIIQNHLLKYNIEIDDVSMIRFVNYVYLFDKIEKTDFQQEYMEISNWYDEWFESLKRDLSYMKFNANQWEDIRRNYYLILLKTPTKSIQKTAKSMIEEYANICEKQEKIVLKDFEKNILLNYLEQWILNQRFKTSRDNHFINEIKKKYVEAFELAHVFSYVFEANGFEYEEEDKAYFALFLNDLIVENNRLFEKKVRIIIIYSSDAMLYYHIRRTIDNTLDSRWYSVEGMNLFRFNEYASTMDSSITLVIDITNHSNFACVQYGIQNLRIHPLLYRKDIENIRNKVLEIRIQNHEDFIQNTLQTCKEKVDVYKTSTNTMNLYSATDFCFVLQEGIFVKRVFDWEAKIEICILDKPIKIQGVQVKVIIEYSYGNDAKWMESMKITKNFMIKHLSVNELISCENKEDLYQIMAYKRGGTKSD